MDNDIDEELAKQALLTAESLNLIGKKNSYTTQAIDKRNDEPRVTTKIAQSRDSAEIDVQNRLTEESIKLLQETKEKKRRRYSPLPPLVEPEGCCSAEEKKILKWTGVIFIIVFFCCCVLIGGIFGLLLGLHVLNSIGINE
jgi:hypothetical protein